MKTFKGILEFIGILFGFYVLMGLFLWEFNPGMWHEARRGFMILGSLFFWVFIQVGSNDS